MGACKGAATDVCFGAQGGGKDAAQVESMRMGEVNVSAEHAANARYCENLLIQFENLLIILREIQSDAMTWVLKGESRRVGS